MDFRVHLQSLSENLICNYTVMKKTILFFALAAVCVLSCTPVHLYYQSYSYEAKLGYSYGTKDDIQLITSKLNDVIGPDATYEKGLRSPVDDKMKAGFAAVEKEYAGKLTSVYFTFTLVKTTINTDPSLDSRVIEELGTYQFGDAVQHPYAFYIYSSDHSDAMAKLRAMKDQLSAEDYKTYGKTLAGIENAFKTQFDEVKYSPYFVSDDNDAVAKKWGDDIYTEYSAQKNAVETTYTISRRDLITAEEVILWQKTLPVNLID